jgi:hypothetical protein
MFLVTTHKGEGYEDGVYSLFTHTKQGEWYTVSNEGTMQIDLNEARQRISDPSKTLLPLRTEKSNLMNDEGILGGARIWQNTFCTTTATSS